MRQTPPNSVAIVEPNQQERTAGLLAAMKDGHVKQFTYKGSLIVRKVGKSVEVADEFERPLGGYMHLESATVNDLLEWIEAKTELYGDNQ